jgi:hypothetical protein
MSSAALSSAWPPSQAAALDRQLDRYNTPVRISRD